MAVMEMLDRRHTVATQSYNRWLIPPAALAVHLCIGQAYATSVYKNSLIEHFDASQTAIGFVFSIAIVMLGLSAAVFGTWVEKVGPRKAMFTAACCWASGFLVGSVGIATEQLWMLYLGYGVIGGIGLGIGYISPVSTLIKWFPDRPGLATGMAIMGFGGGAMVAAPLSRQLLSYYDPAYDPTDAASLADGRALTLLFVTLGIVYFAIMMLGVANIRVPAPGWRPDGFDPSAVKKKALVTENDVSAANAIRTPQFWLLWTVLFCNVTAGIGILEQASPMIQDFFRDGAPPASPWPPPAASWACCRCSTWPAGSCGRAPRTTSAASRSTWSTSAAASSCTSRWHWSARRRPRSSCCSPRSSSRSTVAASPPSRRTSATCSGSSRSAPSTAGC